MNQRPESIQQFLKQQADLKGIQFGLERTLETLNDLGNPHINGIPTIHIAGTNGKGSTCSFIEQLLSMHGKSVGSFTSPHLYSYTERFKINGTPISMDLLNESIRDINQYESAAFLTEFELLSIAAFLMFSKMDLDFIIMETGLGGRLDSSNVCHPSLCVITHIGLDHCELLGNSISKIAYEKAGIIKENIPIITHQNQHKDALDCIQSVATKQASQLIIAKDHELSCEYKVPFQDENLSLAQAAYDFLFEQNLVPKRNFVELKFPMGRYQVQSIDSKIIIKDVAHNPSGFNSLIQSIKSTFPKESDIAFVLGIGQQKDAREIIQILKDYPIYYCEFDQTAWPLKQIQSIRSNIQEYKLNDPLPAHHILAVGGSFYFLEKLTV